MRVMRVPLGTTVPNEQEAFIMAKKTMITKEGEETRKGSFISKQESRG